jgi:hypothetical protein
VAPSTVTWRSSIASSRADWVFGVARVDLVGQDDLGKDGAWAELEELGFLVVEIDAGHIGRQHIRGKLDAAERAADAQGEGACQHRLAPPGTSSISRCPSQSMARRGQADLFVFADDHLAYIFCDTVDKILNQFHELSWLTLTKRPLSNNTRSWPRLKTGPKPERARQACRIELPWRGCFSLAGE